MIFKCSINCFLQHFLVCTDMYYPPQTTLKYKILTFEWIINSGPEHLKLPTTNSQSIDVTLWFSQKLVWQYIREDVGINFQRICQDQLWYCYWSWKIAQLTDDQNWCTTLISSQNQIKKWETFYNFVGNPPEEFAPFEGIEPE